MQFTVKQARHMVEMTQAEMAKRLGINRSTYIKIERSPEKATVGQAQKISQITGIPMEQIFLQ